MSGEIKALIELLEDDSQTVITAVEDRLKELVPESLEALRAARDASSPKVRSRARSILRSLGVTATVSRLEELAGSPNPDLEEMVLWLGRLHDPELDFAAVRHQLDSLAGEAAAEVQGANSPEEALKTFLTFMHMHWGFRGDREDFHAWENNFLKPVLDRRLGMPITLILVYILLGERLNLPIRAIGSPYRALAFFRRGEYQTYIDAFGGGRLWTHFDCVSYLRQSGFKNPDTRHFLRRLSSREIVERITRNMLNVCSEEGRRLECQELRRFAQALIQHRNLDR